MCACELTRRSRASTQCSPYYQARDLYLNLNLNLNTRTRFPMAET